MSGITTSITIAAPPPVVWADIRQLQTHVEWMADAVAIRFTSERREGTGTTFDCDTRVGPLRLTDRMEITEWVDEARMGVRHVGLVTGSGVFTLEPLGDAGTVFTWSEQLRFPWWAGGPAGSAMSRPLLRWIWRRNLVRLKARIERGAATASSGGAG